MRPRAIVLCGGGRRTDPWHDLDATGAAVAGLLTGWGVPAEPAGPRDAAHDGRFDADLLVVNSSDAGPGNGAGSGSGSGSGGLDDAAEAALLGHALQAHVAAGRPILALHSSALAFPDVPGWADILGARWVHGVSHHPEIGATTVQVHPEPWGITSGLADVTLTDERYCDLEPATGLGLVSPYLSHELDGVRHPLAWAREVGPAHARLIYHALGHDVRSYDSSTHRALLAAEVDWLVRRR